MSGGVPDDVVIIPCEVRGWPFDVHCASPAAPVVEALLEAFRRGSGPAAATLALLRDLEGPNDWKVLVDGRVMLGCHLLSDAVHGLMVHVAQAMVAAQADRLSLHAAAAAIGGAAVVMPGASGSGKTTVCGRLLQRGAAYLSDDSIGVEADGRILGYARPLGFKWRAGEAFDGVDVEILRIDPYQIVWYVPPGRLGAGAIPEARGALVAFPRFEPAAALKVEPLARHAAAYALVSQIQNLPAVGVPQALEVVGALVAACPAYTVVYGDSREAADAIEALLLDSEPGAEAAFETPCGRAVGALLFEDGGVLVRADNHELAAVDAMGARVWSLLHTLPLADVAEVLGRDFGVPPDRVRADVSAWLQDLAGRGFSNAALADGPG